MHPGSPTLRSDVSGHATNNSQEFRNNDIVPDFRSRPPSCPPRTLIVKKYGHVSSTITRDQSDKKCFTVRSKFSTSQFAKPTASVDRSPQFRAPDCIFSPHISRPLERVRTCCVTRPWGRSGALTGTHETSPGMSSKRWPWTPQWPFVAQPVATGVSLKIHAQAHWQRSFRSQKVCDLNQAACAALRSGRARSGFRQR